jgi:hypothetical protein
MSCSTKVVEKIMKRWFMILKWIKYFLHKVWIGCGLGYLSSLNMGLRCLIYCCFDKAYEVGNGK